MANRKSETKVVDALRRALGNDYEIRYDDCESCLTRFFYKGVFYKEVPNTEMVPSIDVYDCAAPQELKMQLRFS